jgi:hypothetical protein
VRLGEGSIWTRLFPFPSSQSMFVYQTLGLSPTVFIEYPFLASQSTFMSWVLGPDSRGLYLVDTLLRRLAEEQEVGWLQVFTRELINKGVYTQAKCVSCEAALGLCRYALGGKGGRRPA